MLSRKICVKPRHYVSLAGILRRLGVGLGVGFACAGISGSAHAQQPSGWVGNGHISAYTLSPGEFELSASALQVNDTIDFLNLREDLLSGNSRLIDNSGDLSGSRGEIRAGVWRGLELFYSQQQQDMTLKIGPSSRADLEELDDKLSTKSTAWGAKWVIYESGSTQDNRPRTSAALELSKLDSESDDFGGSISRFQPSPNVVVSFSTPQRFAMNRLQDDGWRARLLLSTPAGRSMTISGWLGYGEFDASSGTAADIEDFPSLSSAFLQTFDIEEKHLQAGASINWQITPRLPLQVGYEYIRVNSRRQTIVASSSAFIPSFLRGSNLAGSADNNHTIYGNIAWWMTPQMHISASGKLFRNQFVGVKPHFNNPLSGSFSNTVYGYVELKLGLKMTLFQ